MKDPQRRAFRAEVGIITHIHGRLARIKGVIEDHGPREVQTGASKVERLDLARLATVDGEFDPAGLLVLHHNVGADSKRLGLLPTKDVSGQAWKFTKGPRVKDE